MFTSNVGISSYCNSNATFVNISKLIITIIHFKVLHDLDTICKSVIIFILIFIFNMALCSLHAAALQIF